MATTDQEMLDLVNAVITKRLNADGYEEYTHREQRFSGMAVKDLFDLRNQLANSIAAAAGGGISLVEYFED